MVRHGTAHCLEAALSAAVILEQHGYPPLVLSFESIDRLDHVIFVYRTATGWGSVARSRDPGLHGRRPVFATPRDLALSYVDPYVDYTGRVTGYAVVDLRVMGDLRLAAVGDATCGRSSGCCSTGRTAGSAPRTGASRGGARATGRSGGSIRIGSRSSIRAAIAGPSCRHGINPKSQAPSPNHSQRPNPKPTPNFH